MSMVNLKRASNTGNWSINSCNSWTAPPTNSQNRHTCDPNGNRLLNSSTKKKSRILNIFNMPLLNHSPWHTITAAAAHHHSHHREHNNSTGTTHRASSLSYPYLSKNRRESFTLRGQQQTSANKEKFLCFTKVDEVINNTLYRCNEIDGPLNKNSEEWREDVLPEWFIDIPATMTGIWRELNWTGGVPRRMVARGRWAWRRGCHESLHLPAAKRCVRRRFGLGELNGILLVSRLLIVSLTRVLRCILGYTNGQQLHHKCRPMTLDVQVRLLIYRHEYVQ